ncbi:hypothetical protein [Nitrosomonas halophila]|uniref:hypothetical protein n=1 Tax=Nitrosomonas halophila TaxID=44576 RepID=UPI0015A17E15|nr:hypothetical protein [Nitrosomonas halophila]
MDITPAFEDEHSALKKRRFCAFLAMLNETVDLSVPDQVTRKQNNRPVAIIQEMDA